MNETVVRECASTDSVVIERFPFNHVQVPVDEIDNVISGLRKARDLVLERRDGPFVQVRFVNAGPSRLYTYRDPSGSCEIGDLVEVPAGYDDTISLAKVEAFGKGSAVKRAKIVKQVHSILKREVL